MDIVACNFSIGVIPEDIALFHSLYRTSVKGRRVLVDNIMELDEFELHTSYDNRVAEIFDVILKSLGIEVEFVDEDTIVKGLDREEYNQYEYNGKTYLCTEHEFEMLRRRLDIREEILKQVGLIDKEELERKIDEELKNRNYITV